MTSRRKAISALLHTCAATAVAGAIASRREKGTWLGKGLWTAATVLVLALAVSLTFIYRKPEPLQQTQFLIDVPPRASVTSDPARARRLQP